MDKIRVMIVEPGKDPRLEMIDNDIHVMQEIVGGYVEAHVMRHEHVYILCHEEGKLRRLPPNRQGLYGTVVMCGYRGTEFTGLTSGQIKHLAILFRRPLVVNLRDRCVFCGAEIPEGRQVCPGCLKL